jgi:hypothetical protein
MKNDFGESHDGHIFSADDAIDSGSGHSPAAHSEELRFLTFLSKFAGERRGEKSAVVLAAGFARRDENDGVRG